MAVGEEIIHTCTTHWYGASTKGGQLIHVQQLELKSPISFTYGIVHVQYLPHLPLHMEQYMYNTYHICHYIWNSACTTPTTPDFIAAGCYIHIFTNVLTVFHSTISGDLSRASGLAYFCSHLITSSNVQLATTHLSSTRHSQTHALCGTNFNLTTVIVFGKSKLS